MTEGDARVEEGMPFTSSAPLIVQDDFGRFRLDLNDLDSPGFESRRFAEQVAAKVVAA